MHMAIIITVVVSIFALIIASVTDEAKKKRRMEEESLAREALREAERRSKQEQKVRERGERENQRYWIKKLRENQRDRVAAEKQLVQITRSVEKAQSLSVLARSLDTARERFLSVDPQAVSGTEADKYAALENKLAADDAVHFNEFISRKFDLICANAMHYKSLNDFSAELNGFFSGLSRTKVELPKETLEYIESLKDKVGLRDENI